MFAWIPFGSLVPHSQQQADRHEQGHNHTQPPNSPGIRGLCCTLPTNALVHCSPHICPQTGPLPCLASAAAPFSILTAGTCTHHNTVHDHARHILDHTACCGHMHEAELLHCNVWPQLVLVVMCAPCAMLCSSAAVHTLYCRKVVMGCHSAVAWHEAHAPCCSLAGPTFQGRGS